MGVASFGNLATLCRTVGDRPRDRPNFPCVPCIPWLNLPRGGFAARLISVWQFRYNILNAVEMSKVKENIEMGDEKSNAKGVSPHLILNRFKGCRFKRL